MIHLITGNTATTQIIYATQLRKRVKSILLSIDHWSKIPFLDNQKTDRRYWFLEPTHCLDKMTPWRYHQLKKMPIVTTLELKFVKKKCTEIFYAFAKANHTLYQLDFTALKKSTKHLQIAKLNKEKGLAYQFDTTPEVMKSVKTWFKPATLLRIENTSIYDNK